MTAETDGGVQRSPWLFWLGAAVFLGSAGLFVYDLVSGNDVVRGLAANGAAAALVLTLAALENLSNPDSHIQTRGEALGAMLLFYGVYLLVAGLVVLVAAVIRHPDPRLGGAYVAVGGALVVVTFLTGGAEASLLDRLTTLAAVLGVALTVGSLGLFLYDLGTGRDVLRGIVINGTGAAMFVLWTAYDMPSDPDSGVDTIEDAFGIALLFYGGYLLVAGATVVATGALGHGRGGVGFLYLALAVVPLVLGFVLAPLDTLTESAESDEATSGETASGDEATSGETASGDEATSGETASGDEAE